MFQDIKVGDVKTIQREITITAIDNVKKQIKMKWKDKLGHTKEQWITYKMYLML